MSIENARLIKTNTQTIEALQRQSEAFRNIQARVTRTQAIYEQRLTRQRSNISNLISGIKFLLMANENQTNLPEYERLSTTFGVNRHSGGKRKKTRKKRGKKRRKTRKNK